MEQYSKANILTIYLYELASNNAPHWPSERVAFPAELPKVDACEGP